MRAMSTAGSSPLPRRVAASLATLLSFFVLVACNGGGSGPSAPRSDSVQVRLLLTLQESTGIEGLQVEFTLAAGVDAIAADPLGPLADASCEENLEYVALACTSFAAFPAPATVYEVTIVRPLTVSANDAVGALTCTGSDGAAELLELPCTLD